jgi:hypothetical protein
VKYGPALLAADCRDEIPGLIDELRQLASGGLIVWMVLYQFSTIGNGESTDAAGGALQFVSKFAAFAGIGGSDRLPNLLRLMHEEGKHFLLKRPIAHRLPGKVNEIEWTSSRSAAGFTTRHRKCHGILVTRQHLTRTFDAKTGA